MGKKFGSREEIIHFAIELLDWVFITRPKHIEHSEKNFTLYQLTCFLLSAKHDEIDENIPLIQDLIRYHTRILPSHKYVPSFEEIVACEKDLLEFFEWDLMIVTPTAVVNTLLANGVVFDNEEIRSMQNVKKVEDDAKYILEVLVKNLLRFRN